MHTHANPSFQRLISLLLEQEDGSFHWATSQIEVRVYHDVTNLSDGYNLDLGWSGYVWPANSNPWVDNYLYYTAGCGSMEEAVLAVEGALKRIVPESLEGGPLPAFSRISGEGDPF